MMANANAGLCNSNDKKQNENRKVKCLFEVTFLSRPLSVLSIYHLNESLCFDCTCFQMHVDVGFAHNFMSSQVTGKSELSVIHGNGDGVDYKGFRATGFRVNRVVIFSQFEVLD